MEARCPSCSSLFAVQRPGLHYCPRCGTQVRVEGEVPTSAPPSPAPPPGAEPAPILREPTPWERRAEVGFFRGLWETFKESLINPEVFWRKLIPAERAADALYYGWLVAVLGALVQGPLQALQMAGQGAQVQQLLGQFPDLPEDLRRVVMAIFSPSGGALLAVVGIALVAVMFPLRLVIQAAILHLFCLLFGAGKNGFWATFRVTAYSSGPLVLVGLPCIGLAAVIYMYVLQIWGVMRAHETTGARATLAVLAFPVLICCVGCGAIILAISALASTLS
jgi:hypothetical protein